MNVQEEYTSLLIGRKQLITDVGDKMTDEERAEKYKETFCNLEMNLNSVTECLEELEKENAKLKEKKGGKKCGCIMNIKGKNIC